jgi:hypothetical protein
MTNRTGSARFTTSLDTGKWAVRTGTDFVEYQHEVTDPKSGYGYNYTKTVRLTAGKQQMTIDHTLRNTGTKAIATNNYNHGFFMLDSQPTGPDITVTFPFDVKAVRSLSTAAEVKGEQIVYLQELQPNANAIAAAAPAGAPAAGAVPGAAPARGRAMTPAKSGRPGRGQRGGCGNHKKRGRLPVLSFSGGAKLALGRAKRRIPAQRFQKTTIRRSKRWRLVIGLAGAGTQDGNSWLSHDRIHVSERGAKFTQCSLRS